MFITLIVVQAFFSFGVTTVTHAMQQAMPETTHYIDDYIFMTADYNLDKISSRVQTGMTQQTHIPIIETGSLLFYSGQYFLDLILNFIFAAPIMLGFLISGVANIIGWSQDFYIPMILFFGVLIQAMYIIGIIQLITGIRSGRVV